MNGADTADHGDSHATAIPRSHGATTAASPSLPMERCCLARRTRDSLSFPLDLLYEANPGLRCRCLALRRRRPSYSPTPTHLPSAFAEPRPRLIAGQPAPNPWKGVIASCKGAVSNVDSGCLQRRFVLPAPPHAAVPDGLLPPLTPHRTALLGRTVLLLPMAGVVATRRSPEMVHR
jgi:hypothetical protein